MLGCTRCKQFGFINLPFENQRFRRWVERHGRIGGSFYDLMLEYVYPRTAIRVCDCCGDGETWFYEPGLHCTTGRCRPGEVESPIDEILIRNQIHPCYWEFLKTGDEKYKLDLGDEETPYFLPGGNAWEKAISELAALKTP